VILDRPVDEIVEEFHEGYMSGEIEVSAYLRSKGLTVEACTCEHTLENDCIYLLSVPSKNVPGLSHYVVVDLRVEGGLCRVYDPNNGKEGKKYYDRFMTLEGVTCGDDITNHPDYETGILGYHPDYKINSGN
jgi:hypothetical protein